MRSKLKRMAASLGYSECEIFPKQEFILIERGDTGSFLNLPYHGGDKTTRYAFKENGESATVEEFIQMYDKYKIPKEKFVAAGAGLQIISIKIFGVTLFPKILYQILP